MTSRVLPAILAFAAMGASAIADERPSLGYRTLSFAKALRSELAKQNMTLPAKDDCFAFYVPCKFSDMPRHLQIWMYPQQDGKIESVKVLIDATESDPTNAFKAGRILCLSTINILATKRAGAPAVERAFDGAETLGRWEGRISDATVTIRVEPQGDLGACEVKPKRPGGEAG